MHCRFCVDWFQPGSTIIANWDKNDKMHNDIINKLSILHCNIDLSPESPLPKNICSKCYMALSFIYKFVKKVNNSQTELYDLYSKGKSNKMIKCEYENKETTNDDGFNMSDFNSTAYFDVEIEGIKYESTKNEIENISADFSTESTSVADETWLNYIWTCHYCNLNFTCMSELICHSRATHDTCYAYRCLDCDKTQTCFRNFIKHVRSHRKHLKKYCPYCNQHISHRKDHISTHTTNRALCTKCGEICDNDTALKLHQNFEPDSLKCKTCLKVYKTLCHLRRHEETVHNRNRTRKYTCDKCGKMYYNQSTLESHILIHDKKHICKICSKTFVSMAKLRRHVDVHIGRKPFACEKCGRTFRLKEQLKSHMIIHTEYMPHRCEVCGKAFRFKQTLVNHSRLHTGVKPYSCSICGMTFANWSNYNKHMVRKHKSDTAKKKITPMGVFTVNPETGNVVKPITTDEIEEWRTKIMVPLRKSK